MALLVSILLGFIPMFIFAAFVYWLDRYEKEPKILLGVAFIWGAIIAALGAYITNTALGIGVYMVTGSDIAADFATGSVIAPIVEESLKGIAVLMVFLFFRREFDSVLDGMIYAGITALGFAATENAFYIFNMGYQENGWSGLWGLAFIRIVLVGWQHPFYTAFIGIGLAMARLNRNWLVKLGAPIIGWIIAVITHSLHNTIASLLGQASLIISPILDWSGWLIMLGFIIYMIYRERTLLRKQLVEEVNLGIITPVQYHTACSASARSSKQLTALTQGRYQKTNRFFQVCGELAHKKNQYLRVGNETDNQQIIQSLREELRKLSPFVG